MVSPTNTDRLGASRTAIFDTLSLSFPSNTSCVISAYKANSVFLSLCYTGTANAFLQAPLFSFLLYNCTRDSSSTFVGGDGAIPTTVTLNCVLTATDPNSDWKFELGALTELSVTSVTSARLFVAKI